VTDRPEVLLLLMLGVIPLFEGTAPVRSASPPADSPPARAAAPEVPSLRWISRKTDGTDAAVEVRGLDRKALAALSQTGMTRERWTSLLTVRVIADPPARRTEPPPLLGSYQVDGEILRFVPRFPLEPGLRYRAELDSVRLNEILKAPADRLGRPAPERKTTIRLTADFSPPKRAPHPPAKVTRVYPSRAVLPENLLRFYIHFSAPMSRGEAYQRIRLLDATGKPVNAPFLELDEELWSRDGMRFTLLFEPGRVKRGLKPREDLGPILEAGKSYQLVVDGGWPDAEGNPLEGAFCKAFRTAPADETSPDPKTWDIRPPAAESREPLEVRFPEPLDRAMLDRLVIVRDAAGNAVAGQVSVTGEETLWRFTPAHPWRASDYRLVIGTELEDPSGNSVARPFEVDAVGPITQKTTSETVIRPFRIGPKPQ
jgi:hypothetical protein